MQKENSTKRRGRLRRFHDVAAMHLRLIDTGDIKTLPGNRRSITFRLRKLAETAGVSHEGLKNDEIYTESIRALIAQGKGDDHPHAETLRETLRRVREGVLNQKPSPPRQAQPAEPKQWKQVIVDAECGDALACFGLLAEDEVELAVCDDPRPGEVLLIWEKGEEGGKGEWLVGRFREYVEDDEWGRTPYIEMLKGGYRFKPAAHEFYRVTSIKRTVKVERPGDGEGKAALLAQEIRRLRERLDRIDRDDITNCTAVMKLEKQIYDLEHPIDLDDWSAWEEGGA